MEVKGHYLNSTAGTCESMMDRAQFAKDLGVPIVMHDYLTGGLSVDPSNADVSSKSRWITGNLIINPTETFLFFNPFQIENGN